MQVTKIKGKPAVTETVIVEPAVQEQYTVTMNRDEAMALLMMTGRVSGGSKNTEPFTNLRFALRNLGLNYEYDFSIFTKDSSLRVKAD